MKKYILYFLIFTLLMQINNVTFAAEKESSSSWGENTSVFNSGFSGQKPVTDNKLNKTIKMLKERSLSNKQKKIQREVKPLSPNYDMDHLKNFTQEQAADDGIGLTGTIMIPMRAYNDEGKYINPGYYKLSCRKITDNEYVLDLSQGNQLILSVKAMPTKQDLEQDTISFCNSEIIDNNRIRLMYGSIELNLVGYLYFK